MSTFELRILAPLREGEGRAVCILIDGRELIDMLKEVEAPFATREEHPDLAGGYSWLSAEDHDAAYFLGQAAGGQPSSSLDKVALLECSCGCPGCWPFLARISVLASTVVWDDFEQPYRRVDSATLHWDYSSFGPFQFDRAHYERELERFSLALEQATRQTALSGEQER